ncbi:MAG: FAD-dependent oxidoreductase [Verrucomicrobiota bacterium]
MNLRSALFAALLFPAVLSAESRRAEVVVYGGTSAAVMAAVQVKKMGKSVVIVSPDKHLGGLSSGGLGWTDTGDKTVIGGLARDFYHRIYQHYQGEDAWKWQKREEYGNKGQGNAASDHGQRTMWIFEPHVAEAVFDGYVKEYEIPVYRAAFLDREKGVVKKEGKIISITTLAGDTFSAEVFLDTTYEGDLMAAAGVNYTVGRESAETYGEKWAGVQTGTFHHAHHFARLAVDPYLVPGDPASGVIPLVSAEPPGAKGSGDKRVQAYNFRLCLTNSPGNRIPFEKPPGYDEKHYELLGRIYDAGWRDTFGKFDPIPNRKTDTNNHGPVSTDFIGGNFNYPEAGYEERRRIFQAHKEYTQGWLYYHLTSSRVPEEIRKRMAEWGLPKDEFQDSGNWSPQLYIREARRMVGRFVMTEHELLKKRPTPDSVGMGSYSIDSHNTQRYITGEGHVQNEGDIGVALKPYEIAYGSLIPKTEECKNLLVPCAISSSHVAYGSIRMEPVFMILGQSAATAAVMALEKKIPVQEIDCDELRSRLREDGQVLTMEDRIK